ncbi:hypothetical protein ACVWZ4_007396 [Bradyrhizobium sp. USDA 4472]
MLSKLNYYVAKKIRTPQNLAILVLLVMSSTACCWDVARAQDSSSRYGMGGRIRDFKEYRQQASQTGQPFRIEGHCQSACTMFLRLRNACVDPNAELLFHAGSDQKATQSMLNSYNGALRSYLLANHIMDTTSFTTISGRDIIHRFGYRACSPKT